MITVVFLDKRATPDHVGLIPHFLDADDPRPAAEQFDANYQHGGGFRPISGFTMNYEFALKYPGDPTMRPLAMIKFRDERVLIYEYGVVAVIQPDGKFEAARMD
jgi:hypothetical protein